MGEHRTAPTYFDLAPQSDQRWLMRPGERFALDGLLAHLRPALAIEVGTYEGGSLRRIAAFAKEVHTFDLDPAHGAEADPLPNVTFHSGDSTETLPRELARMEAEGRNVDFALVDGAHTKEAVLSDARALLASRACRNTAIVFHDSAHVDVRAALEELDLPAHPKVGLCLLDWVPGYLVGEGHEVSGEAFNGLALVVLDGERGPRGPAEGDGGVLVPVPDLHRAYLERRRRHSEAQTDVALSETAARPPSRWRRRTPR